MYHKLSHNLSPTEKSSLRLIDSLLRLNFHIINIHVLFAEAKDNNYHQHFCPADYMRVGVIGERILRLGLVMILTFISRSNRDRLWGSQDFCLADYMGVGGMGGMNGFKMTVDELFNLANMNKSIKLMP